MLPIYRYKSYRRKEEKEESRMRRNMEFKNRKFRIFDSVWTIKFENRYFDAKDFKGEEGTIFGLTDPDNRVIRISLLNRDGKTYPESQVKVTVLHELMHAIFMEGQYLNEFNDEHLVEWSAKCINQLLNQHMI